MSIIHDDLLDFNYYKNLLPMYLSQDENFLSHFKALFDVGLKRSKVIGEERTSSIVSTFEDFFADIDIFNITHNQHERSDDVLDKLASLFGVARQFSVTVSGTTEALSLSDDELITLIKCQVIKNFFNGSFEEFRSYYDLVNLPVIALTSSTSAASCDVYMLLSRQDAVTSNIKKMFLAGMLSIESLGIAYSYNITIASNIAIFDSTSASASFDQGQFIR